MQQLDETGAMAGRLLSCCEDLARLETGAAEQAMNDESAGTRVHEGNEPGTRVGSWVRMLRSIPAPNQAARVERLPDRSVTLHVKKAEARHRRRPFRRFVTGAPERRVMLDRLGTQVWELCDGKRTVESVVDAFAASHGLTFHESRAAVSTYLKMLTRHGVIAVVLPEENRRAKEGTLFA
jgi:hypothetical protein